MQPSDEAQSHIPTCVTPAPQTLVLVHRKEENKTLAGFSSQHHVKNDCIWFYFNPPQREICSRETLMQQSWKLRGHFILFLLLWQQRRKHSSSSLSLCVYIHCTLYVHTNPVTMPQNFVIPLLEVFSLIYKVSHKLMYIVIQLAGWELIHINSCGIIIQALTCVRLGMIVVRKLLHLLERNWM